VQVEEVKSECAQV